MHSFAAAELSDRAKLRDRDVQSDEQFKPLPNINQPPGDSSSSISISRVSSFGLFKESRRKESFSLLPHPLQTVVKGRKVDLAPCK